MWTLPSAWEDALWAAARALLPAAVLDDSRILEAAIVRRTRLYTTERQALHTSLPEEQRKADLAARTLFFTVADAAKVAIPIAELRGRGLLDTLPTPLRVLDVGAGMGAMTLGLAAALPDCALDVTAVDRDPSALAIFEHAARVLPVRLALRTLACDALARGYAGEFDVILLGTVLNELPREQQLPLLVRLLTQHLAFGGAAIVIEPALRETARALHELRDALLQAGIAHVFAPCTRTAAPCPALADARDWCHEDRPFAPPPRLAMLSRRTSLRQGGLKFAYLTLRRQPGSLISTAKPARSLRVVSDALDQKGVLARMVCDDEGRRLMRVLKRDRTDENRALGDTRRGDVVVLDEGRITRIQPAH